MRAHNRSPLCAVVVAAVMLVLTAVPAQAFDYFEHTYLSDRACLEAQRALLPYVAQGDDDDLVAHYLALALACPEAWRRPYCVDGYKQLEGGINRLSQPPPQSGDHSVTLGDFAALSDHLSAFGRIRKLPHAEDEGLVDLLLDWLAAADGDAGGVVADVAEDACEMDRPLPWHRLDDELTAFLRAAEEEGGVPPLQPALMSPLARAQVKRGPHDPAGPYSFDNPHYLDLVRRNRQHFGNAAFATSLGYRTAAVEIAASRCVDVLGLDGDALDDLRDEAAAAAPAALVDLDFEELGTEAQRIEGCRLLASLVRRRLREWGQRGAPELVAPVRHIIAALDGDAPLPPRLQVLLDRTSVSLLAMPFLGAGLHYLQDNFSGGHLRVEPSPHDLEESRHAHDVDSEAGVRASVQTRSGVAELVAFGDGYLFGWVAAEDEEAEKAASANEQAEREGAEHREAKVAEAQVEEAQVEAAAADGHRLERAQKGEELQADCAGVTSAAALARCLLARQRGTIFVATTAALLDWAYGGLLGEDEPRRSGAMALPAQGCPEVSSPARFVCRHLPVRPVVAGGTPLPAAPVWLPAGSLPATPAPFSYQSLLVATALDGSGHGLQLGVRAVFLSQLGARANWMTSYNVGLLTSVVGRDGPSALGEFSYMFHWRWAARFLINAGPFVDAGLRGFGDHVSAYAGVGPSVGVSTLPEGWTKIPIELTLSYRMPLTLLDSRYGWDRRGIRIEAHWIDLAVGLAFM